jgi:hypothetical protein
MTVLESAIRSALHFQKLALIRRSGDNLFNPDARKKSKGPENSAVS